jgi:hypothetical protein
MKDPKLPVDVEATETPSGPTPAGAHFAAIRLFEQSQAPNLQPTDIARLT